MGWQLSTAIHRLGLLRRADSAPVGDETAPADVRLATADRARALLAAPDRDRYDAVLAAGPAEDLARGEVLRRVLATSWSVDAVAELAEVWSGLSPSTRAAVLDPVHRFSPAGRQTDGTTCGSAVLTLLAAAGDPALALWLANGQVLAHSRPPELAAASADRLAALAEGPPQRRFAPAQQVVKRRTNARGALGLPWPTALGTPPWGAASQARFVGLGFGHEPLDDTDRPHLTRVLDRVAAALDRGVPVPLYTGGDTARGWATAVPRHVVLAVGHSRSAREHSGQTFELWEPAAGHVVPISRAALLAGGAPHRALGGWNHPVWAVLPDL